MMDNYDDWYDKLTSKLTSTLKIDLSKSKDEMVADMKKIIAEANVSLEAANKAVGKDIEEEPEIELPTSGKKSSGNRKKSVPKSKSPPNGIYMDATSPIQPERGDQKPVFVGETPSHNTRTRTRMTALMVATTGPSASTGLSLVGSGMKPIQGIQSTARNQRFIARVKTPQEKTEKKREMTDSAMKRKQELDSQRILLLQNRKEKEDLAEIKKQQLLEEKVQEHKRKREEKERKAAEMRAQLEKDANEKRLRESAKKREVERRRREIEEAKRDAARRKAEQMKKQEDEAEIKKQQEERERVAQQQREVITFESTCVLYCHSFPDGGQTSSGRAAEERTAKLFETNRDEDPRKGSPEEQYFSPAKGCRKFFPTEDHSRGQRDIPHDSG